MPVVLCRVDERLIHGQVVIGWGHELRPDRYVVVDDEIADTPWEQELYALGAPEAATTFFSLQGARTDFEAWCVDPARTVILTRTIRTMRLLLDGQSSNQAVNLGGLHASPERARVLDYLHLSRADREDLSEMAARGVAVSARDLPDAVDVDLETLLAT